MLKKKGGCFSPSFPFRNVTDIFSNNANSETFTNTGAQLKDLFDVARSNELEKQID